MRDLNANIVYGFLVVVMYTSRLQNELCKKY